MERYGRSACRKHDYEQNPIRKWEVAISPDSGNGLSKPSVIRIDKTISIAKSRITTDTTWKIGETNPFVLIVAKEKLAEWLESHA